MRKLFSFASALYILAMGRLFVSSFLSFFGGRIVSGNFNNFPLKALCRHAKLCPLPPLHSHSAAAVESCGCSSLISWNVTSLSCRLPSFPHYRHLFFIMVPGNEETRRRTKKRVRPRPEGISSPRGLKVDIDNDINAKIINVIAVAGLFDSWAYVGTSRKRRKCGRKIGRHHEMRKRGRE